jgi:twitching motility two-component system response regulator PilG
VSRLAKVLLADDSPHAQRMGERILREEGYEVVTVTDGETAMLRLNDINPDVVIVDTFLPQVSGYDLCSFIRKQPRHAHVHVILTSTALERVDEDQAYYVGADGQLKKPFEASVMLKSLKDLLTGSDKDGKKRRTGLGLDLSSPLPEQPAKEARQEDAAPAAAPAAEKGSLIQAWLDKQTETADAETEAPDPLGLAEKPAAPKPAEPEKVTLANPQLLRKVEEEPEDLSLRNNPVAKLRHIPAPPSNDDSPRVRTIKAHVFGTDAVAPAPPAPPAPSPVSSDPADAAPAGARTKRSLLEALADYERASEPLDDPITSLDDAASAAATSASTAPAEAQSTPVHPLQPVATPEPAPQAVSAVLPQESTPKPAPSSVDLSVPVPQVSFTQAGVRLDQEEIRAAVEIAVSAALPAIVAEVSRCITLALESRYRDAQEKQSGRVSG